MSIAQEWFVQVISHDTGEVVKSLGPNLQREAEKIDRGMNINLDHERFYTRVVRSDAAKTEPKP